MEEEINAQMKYKKLLIEVSLKFDNTKQRKNRYFLSYIWDNKKPALGVIMFNPSYANEIKPDRTHARLINKFQDKYGGLKVLNLISTIDKNPKNLEKDVKIDIIDHIDKLDTEEVVIAWGSLPKLLSRENRSNLNDIIKKIEEKIKKIKKWQLNKDKQVHPLIGQKIDLNECTKIDAI